MTADDPQHRPRSHHGHGKHGHNHGHAARRVPSNATGGSTSGGDLPEIGYPRGHIGHLSEDEEKAFAEFKAYIAEQGVYKPGPPPSHDDPTLLRFLRARRWVVLDAYKQFKETEDWREANQLDVLYDSIDLDAYEQSRRLYPQWTGRRDRRGIPLYLFEIRHLDSKTIANYEKTAEATYSRAHTDGKTPPKLLRLFALYENLTRFAQPLCTELTDRDHSNVPITLSTNIVDVSQVSLKQFWNLKGHMQAASQLATAHYPETLDRIFIIGAPFFFSTVWGWIKRWFDPITVSKIFILAHHEVLPTLRTFIDVRNIPKQYGGELDFSWGEMPNLDPNIVEAVSWENGHTAFPKGPVYWRPLDDDTLECVAVGSVEQKERMERVGTIRKTYRGPFAKVPEDEEVVEAAEQKKEQEDEPKPAVTTGVETSVTDAKTEAKPAAEQTAAVNGEPTITEVQGVQNLSIQDDNEKKEQKEAETVAPAQAPVA
ncbi:uncharacterized protein E0L32_010002 [Thyridium curvatum]|uniref:CRAL-TRIO domain-containing protein n=1 Tax=Thyridium curvatum TaxID=1093900 RepID=A0A507AFV5_9PEZI|nr:uncharacterized protein E0L32_010002 [Thyridium curvatum]TPX08515.1 hypothetical protein E0L32_010002 [Thyridium curvatum]